MQDAKWIRCPVCGNKTRDRIREDTVLKNYPLYCPKCKQETLIKVKSLQVTVIKVVLVYKCGQKKLNNLYYQTKEQRR